jgi:hypothetical protein
MPRRTLGRELLLALLFKAAAIFLLWFWFFGPAHRVHVTPADMAAVVAGPLAQGPRR